MRQLPVLAHPQKYRRARRQATGPARTAHHHLQRRWVVTRSTQKELPLSFPPCPPYAGTLTLLHKLYSDTAAGAGPRRHRCRGAGDGDLAVSTASGDPDSPLRWTSKSVRKLCGELRTPGHEVSHQLVAELLRGSWATVFRRTGRRVKASSTRTVTPSSEDQTTSTSGAGHGGRKQHPVRRLGTHAPRSPRDHAEMALYVPAGARLDETSNVR